MPKKSYNVAMSQVEPDKQIEEMSRRLEMLERENERLLDQMGVRRPQE